MNSEASADVRLVAHSGHKSDNARGPRMAWQGQSSEGCRSANLHAVSVDTERAMSQLFEVAGPPKEPRASVLFVHGLGGHHYDTWRCNTDGKPWNEDDTFWPLWLVRDCETLAVYVIGYDAPISR